MWRERVWYVVATLVVVALGLATLPLRRTYPAAMDAVGDALWAAMVFLGLSAVVPAVAVWKRAAAAIAFAFVIEFSQMYRSPGLDRVRATTLGHLVLGSGFDPMDLVKYLAGVAGAAWVAVRRQP